MSAQLLDGEAQQRGRATRRVVGDCCGFPIVVLEVFGEIDIRRGSGTAVRPE